MIASNYFIKNNQLYCHTANPTHQCQVILQSELPRILWLNHQHPLGGYFGIIATYEKIKQFYYWNNMFKDIKLYIQQCDRCQHIRKQKINEQIYPIKIGQPF